MTASDVLALPLRPFSRAGMRLRERVRGWMQSRRVASDTLLLGQRNVYILPTRAGLMFALTLVVLLLASINYQLNLGFVLTFLLAGSGVVSMHVTHNTLRGLTLQLRTPAPVFAGQAAPLEVVLTSPAQAQARHGIGLRLDAAPGAISWIDVPAGGRAAAHVSFVPARRGLHAVPALRVETRFPLGLFRAWTVWQPASQVLAYPAPEALPAALPAAHTVGSESSQARRGESGDTEGVRAYRRGDALKLVVWKKVAKYAHAGGEMVSRDTAAPVQQQLWLDFQACGIAGAEARLSRLAAWVQAADRGGAEYGLRLPGQELAAAQGEAHRRACLEALALWR